MYVVLLAIMIFVSAALAGLFAPPFDEGKKNTLAMEEYTCCDTGDGDQCRPLTDRKFSFRGEEYALLKSDVYITAHNGELLHLDAAQPRTERRGQRVFINPNQRSSGVRKLLPECTESTLNGEPYDRIYGEPVNNQGKGCYAIPDDMLVYLCREAEGHPGACDRPQVSEATNVKFDVYIRLSDLTDGTIEDLYPSISSCFKPPSLVQGEEDIVFEPSPGGQKNLQLRTFGFEIDEPNAEWLAPFCKPAVYLYPERKTEINVKVAPKGEMLLTIPEYPSAGWDVVAEPNGDIFHHNTRFDYLYYEASIPDELIKQPEAGFVVPYEERESLMRNLVTRLGLNEKETQQFVEYWAPILPEAPYYFIGIVPVTNLDAISPVTISPKPDNFIRITLYFQALDTYKHVQEPIIPVVKRDGFTAVEWGGIFKQDGKHPFSCFM